MHDTSTKRQPVKNFAYTIMVIQFQQSRIDKQTDVSNHCPIQGDLWYNLPSRMRSSKHISHFAPTGQRFGGARPLLLGQLAGHGSCLAAGPGIDHTARG